ncbi:MAG: 4-hydroxy-3-methylbut-2-enyl diphosphate reductase [Thermoleophilia bacterium]|nr:4-hydroxy-3-methylbut-2-enyl diphosphate reductase [Thermoleophilia bacterium]
MSKRVLVAAPRSFCAGVVRAIDIVETLLETHGPPVYVRHQIVHNVHVVRDLEARGAIFVESEQEVPEGALVVLSAHGVAPQVYRKCAERDLKVIDATCPLVSKVHAEARRYAARGLKIALVGHAGHEEVVGTMGEAPDAIVLVETAGEAERLELDGDQGVAYLTQTTLSVDDTADVVDALRDRFPDLVGPPSADICYATQNRQDAVKKICEQATLVLVVGSTTSSNANRLVEVARTCGADAYLVDDESDLDPAWLVGHETVGLTAGASSPDLLVNRVADRLAELGFAERVEVELTREDVYFRLPAELR